MSRQGNLDSFFGVAKEKRVPTQAKLNFQNKDDDGANEVTPPKAEEKENASENAPLQDSDDEAAPQSKPKNLAASGEKRAAAASNKEEEPSDGGQEKKRARRLAIVDDDEDDDKEMEDVQAVEEDEPKDDDEEEEESKKPAATNDKKKKVVKKSSSAGASSVVGKMSNEQLLKAVTWNKSSEKTKGGDSPPTLPYAILCNDCFEPIQDITGRKQIIQIVTNLFRQVLQVNPQDLYTLLYLVSNTVAPSYECIELGIGDSILIKAIGEAYGTNASKVKEKYKKDGDLGTVAKESKAKQTTLSFGAKPKPLLAKEVLAAFLEIAKTKGAKSQKWKKDKIKSLLVRAQGLEAKYIIRGLQGKLRIGLARSTVLIALAHALTLSPPPTITGSSELSKDDMPEEAWQYANPKSSAEDQLKAATVIMKKAYSESSSYDALLDAALRVPLEELHKVCSLTPGIPVGPMLAKPTNSIHDVLKRLNGNRFTCEFKYDGERAQVHMLPDGTTKVFSRNLLNTSEKYPEVPQYVKEACVPSKNVESFVLDAEVVAFDRDTGKLVPFQILSTRKKTEASGETAKVQVIVEAFDLMYLNGERLLNKTLEERRKLLREHFQAVEGKFQFATYLDHKEDGDTTVLEELLDKAVKSQCEGLMVKTLDVNSAYEPSERTYNWLKLKKDYLEGLGDSFDLVPIGAYHGRGKRTGLYGAYLLACYDPETEEFQSVCKIGTGFLDEDLKSLHESFQDHIIEKKDRQYVTSDRLDCDVWFDAVQVWEVKAADLSKSSDHKGALGKTGEAGRGIGLRFPRFERVREDKKPENATTSDQVLEMYYRQDTIVDGGEDNDDDEGI